MLIKKDPPAHGTCTDGSNVGARLVGSAGRATIYPSIIASVLTSLPE